jgi:uncharacterized protein YegL
MKLRDWVVVLVVGGLAALMFANIPAEAAMSPSVKAVEVSISINNSYAVTRVNEEIVNPSGFAVSATFSFQIPEEAFISNFSLRLDDRTYYGQVVPAQQAKEAYDKAVSEGRNAALLASRGKSLFSYSVNLKPGQTVVAGLVFEQFLRQKDGAFVYSLCLDNSTFGGSSPSIRVASAISYSSALESLAIQNYTVGTSIQWRSAGSVSTSYQASRFSCRGDYVIRYTIAKGAAAGTVTPYYDGHDTYFMHVFEPAVSDLGGSPMAKQVVFVLDRSGSMSGLKIAQVKTAFCGIIRQLRPEDSFNLVYFSSQVSKWKDGPVRASKENIDAAVNAMKGLSAAGSTNFNGALGTALDMIKERENSASIVVMLTDGQPTSGVTNKNTIRSEARSKNTLRTPIYCLGFGNDVDFPFLKALSLESGARALKISVGSDAADQIKDFFGTVADPLMNGIGFSYYPGAETHILGGSCLYGGSQMVVVGRISGKPSVLSVQVSGKDRNGDAGFSGTYAIAHAAQDPMVVRFYNFARINELLDRITVDGPNSPLIPEATSLSVQNGFVTPYTSMLIDVGEQQQPAPAQSLIGNGAREYSRSPSAAFAMPYGSELVPVALFVVLVAGALRRRLSGPV